MKQKKNVRLLDLKSQTVVLQMNLSCLAWAALRASVASLASASKVLWASAWPHRSDRKFRKAFASRKQNKITNNQTKKVKKK